MDNKFIRAEEVAQELSVSKPYAYKLIRQLNEELKEKGFITITGRVNHHISMKGSTEQERRKNNASIKVTEDNGTWVCDGKICELERRA